MSLHRLRNVRTRNIVAFWLIPLVLVSLGLRVCLHTPDTAEPGPAHAATVHLENDLTSSVDPDDARNDHVSPAFAPFKVDNLADLPVLAAVLTAILSLLLPSATTRVFASAGILPVLSGGHRFRPPLRAPPR